MNTRVEIPFNRPYVSGRELVYIKQVLDRRHFSGDGEFTKRCNKFLESFLQVPKVLLTTSCTHALEMAVLLANIEQGDEVILPAPVSVYNQCTTGAQCAALSLALAS